MHAHFVQLDKFFYIYFTNTKLLNSHTVAFWQYQKKYCILHIVFTSIEASSNKFSEFNFISLFNFLSKQNYLEYELQMKI